MCRGSRSARRARSCIISCMTPSVFRRSETKPAVLLLSGGLDSTTMLALATSERYDVNALTFRYGQRHEHEVDSARTIAGRYRVARHVVMDIDLRAFGGSSLTGSAPVPKDRSVATIAGEIPSTYVPARNTVFLSFALAWAETLGAHEIGRAHV